MATRDQPPPPLPPFDLITGADTRSSLLASAVDLFAVKGFHGTTTRDIATAAGLSPASVYVHFASKEQLLSRISHAGHAMALRVVEESLSSADDPATSVANLIYNFVAYHLRHQRVARVITNELESLDPEHLAEILAIRRAMQDLICDAVEVGMATGHFSCADPHLTATMITSLGIDVARWYHPQAGWHPETVADRYREMILRVLHPATST